MADAADVAMFEARAVAVFVEYVWPHTKGVCDGEAVALTPSVADFAEEFEIRIEDAVRMCRAAAAAGAVRLTDSGLLYARG